MSPPKKAEDGAFPVGALKLLPGGSIDDTPTDMAWIAAKGAPIVAKDEPADRDGRADKA